MDEVSTSTSQKRSYITLTICNNNFKYDQLLIHPKKVVSKNSTKKIKSETQFILLTNDMSCGDCHVNNNLIPVKYTDGILAHYVVQELGISPTYRKTFIHNVQSFYKNDENKIIFKLIPTDKQIIDYSWNNKTTNLAWERVELDHALSWLSTLGGAFSALGDYFSNCALIAGNISIHQLQLALRLGDPTIASRCRLYFSLSLIQRGHLKVAKNIISNEYHLAKNATVVDIRLINMCLGIWAKLKYEYHKKQERKM